MEQIKRLIETMRKAYKVETEDCDEVMGTAFIDLLEIMATDLRRTAEAVEALEKNR